MGSRTADNSLTPATYSRLHLSDQHRHTDCRETRKPHTTRNHVRGLRTRAAEQCSPGGAIKQGDGPARRHRRHLRQCSQPRNDRRYGSFSRSQFPSRNRPANHSPFSIQSNTFSSMSSSMKGSAGRLTRMAASGNKVAILKLSGIVIAAFLVLYYGTKIIFRW